MATQQEVIKKFMASLDTTTLSGGEALNAAIKAAANSTFSDFQAIKKAMINDCNNAKSGDDFLKTYCGIDLDNEDTGAITGLDAGGSIVKTAESIVPEEGSLENFTGNSFTLKSGLTIQLASFNSEGKNPVEITYNDNDLNGTQKYIWQALKTWWANGALDLISESYSDDFGFSENSTATVKKLYFGFCTKSGDFLGETTWTYNTDSGETGQIRMRVNMSYYDSLENGGNPDGKTTGYGTDNADYLDRILAHEFTHAVMVANINYADELPNFIKEGIPEITIGIDNWRTDDIKKLASDSTLLEQALSLSKDDPIVSGVSNPSYAGGYMFLRYLARQMGDLTIENTTANKSIQTFYGNDSIKSSGSKAKINSGAGNDSITNLGASVSIDGGAGNDLLSNDHANKVTLIGGAGNDTIWNWSTSNTAAVGASVSIAAGAGNDTVWNSGSKAKIKGDAGDDSITNLGASVSIDGGAGNDLLSNDHANKVTLIGGAGNDTIWNWSTSNTAAVGASVSIAAGAGNDTIWNEGTSVTIDAGAGYDTVSNFESKVTIAGGAGNDSLKNYGGSNVSIDGGADDDFLYNDSIGSNVIMLGGAGNDTVWNWGSNVTINCGTGNDTVANDVNLGKKVLFKYTSGDGNDLIAGFNSTSTLQIGDGEGTYSSAKSGSNIIVTVGTGKITLEGATSLSKINIAGKETATLLTVTNSTKSPVTVDAAIRTINASKRTTAVKITGNTLNNTIYGGSGNDSLVGVSGSNYIIGNAGNDSIFGGEGNDTLRGYAGADYIVGNAGNDSILGGDGNDTIRGYSGADKLYGNAGNDSILGGDGNDTILGQAGADKLYGNAGNDSILGGDGNDTILGQAGADKLYGNAGNDSILGGDGNDTLSGGAGNDTLWGNAGADTFIYASGDGNDIVYGFENNDLLKITGTFSASYNSNKKEIYFKVGSTANAITLKDFSATTFNVNGTNYKISGTKLTKK